MAQQNLPDFDALSVADEALHPGQPWRVICHVVKPDGSVTQTVLTRFCESEDQAEEWVWMASEMSNGELRRLQDDFIHAMRHHAAEHRDCAHTVPHGAEPVDMFTVCPHCEKPFKVTNRE